MICVHVYSTTFHISLALFLKQPICPTNYQQLRGTHIKALILQGLVEHIEIAIKCVQCIMYVHTYREL